MRIQNFHLCCALLPSRDENDEADNDTSVLDDTVPSRQQEQYAAVLHLDDLSSILKHCRIRVLRRERR
jgi:hypothetical protein